MKINPIWVILIIVVIIGIILYVSSKNSTSLLSGILQNNNSVNQSTLSNSQNTGFNIGYALSNLIGSTKCGKNGNPPCTVKDLQDAGWTPQQIAEAQSGSQALSNFQLCQTFGIGC